MTFDCTIPAKYTIPDSRLQEVINAHREAWGDQAENAELFPNDLIRRAQDMGIGALKYHEADVESTEESLAVEDLPKGVK